MSTTTHKIYLGSLLYLVLLFFSGLFDLSFNSRPQNKLLLLRLHTSILSCGVLLFQLMHVQRQKFEDSLSGYLKQWTLSSILKSYNLYCQVLGYNTKYIKILIFIRLHINLTYVTSEVLSSNLVVFYWMNMLRNLLNAIHWVPVK